MARPSKDRQNRTYRVQLDHIGRLGWTPLASPTLVVSVLTPNAPRHSVRLQRWQNVIRPPRPWVPRGAHEAALPPAVDIALEVSAAAVRRAGERTTRRRH
jgi:hypothetical protein